MKFRKKPVVIEAYQLIKETEHTVQLPPKWFVAALVNGTITEDDGRTRIYIKTLEGIMQANIGDWIIQGVKGELYPCKPSIFAATYEAYGN